MADTPERSDTGDHAGAVSEALRLEARLVQQREVQIGDRPDRQPRSDRTATAPPYRSRYPARPQVSRAPPRPRDRGSTQAERAVRSLAPCPGRRRGALYRPGSVPVAAPGYAR